MGIHAFFVEIGDGGGCVLERDPERQSRLLTHSVFVELRDGRGRVLEEVPELLLLVLGLRRARRLVAQLGRQLLVLLGLRLGQALPLPLREPVLRPVLLDGRRRRRLQRALLPPPLLHGPAGTTRDPGRTDGRTDGGEGRQNCACAEPWTSRGCWRR